MYHNKPYYQRVITQVHGGVYSQPEPVGNSPECKNVLRMSDLLVVLGDLREMGYDTSMRRYDIYDVAIVDLSSEATVKDREVPISYQ